VRPIIPASRLASAAGDRSSGSENSISNAAGFADAMTPMRSAILSRGHGHAPISASDRRSTSMTIRFAAAFI
jgi:hypothetical protein